MEFTGKNEENKDDKVLSPTCSKPYDETDQLAANDEQNIEEQDSMVEANYQPPILVQKVMAHVGLKQGDQLVKQSDSSAAIPEDAKIDIGADDCQVTNPSSCSYSCANFARNQTFSSEMSELQARESLEQERFRLLYRLVQLRSKAARQMQNFRTDDDSDSEYGDESEEEVCKSDVADCTAVKPTVNLLERDESTPIIRKFERDLWVVNGVLAQGLDRALLEKVSKNF